MFDYFLGLTQYVEKFLFCAGVLILTTNVGVSFGYIIAALVNNVNMAMALGPPMIIPFMLFGGFFINSSSIPDFLVWLKYLSWFLYSNELLVINQWEDIENIECPSNITTGGESRCYNNGEMVINFLNFEKDNTVINIVILCGLLVGFRLVAYIVLFLRTRFSTS